MFWCLARLRAVACHKRATTTVEFALFTALVAVIIVNGAANLGHNSCATFNQMASEL